MQCAPISTFSSLPVRALSPEMQSWIYVALDEGTKALLPGWPDCWDMLFWDGGEESHLVSTCQSPSRSHRTIALHLRDWQYVCDSSSCH